MTINSDNPEAQDLTQVGHSGAVVEEGDEVGGGRVLQLHGLLCGPLLGGKVAGKIFVVPDVK